MIIIIIRRGGDIGRKTTKLSNMIDLLKTYVGKVDALSHGDDWDEYGDMVLSMNCSSRSSSNDNSNNNLSFESLSWLCCDKGLVSIHAALVGRELAPSCFSCFPLGLG